MINQAGNNIKAWMTYRNEEYIFNQIRAISMHFKWGQRQKKMFMATKSEVKTRHIREIKL